MKKVFLFAFFLMTINIVAQETKFSKAVLIRDLDSLVSYIEQVHPNPYTIISGKQFHREIEQCKKMLKDSTTVIDYFTQISPIISRLNDGHTGVEFPVAAWMKSNPVCISFKPIISKDGRMFTPDTQSELPQNAEILSINGIAARQIVDKLAGAISGESLSYRRYLLGRSFLERFGAFYGYKPSNKIIYKTEVKNVSTTIPGIKLTELLELKRKQQKNAVEKEEPSYSYKSLNNGQTGIIDFRSFTDLPRFTHFLDSIFTIVKREKTENLIIDLRNNGGGNSELGDELFQYISRVPFSQYGKGTVKYSQIRTQFYTQLRNQSDFLKYLSDSAFNKLLAPQFKSGTMQSERETLKLLRENPLRFSGKVYLLTSTETFSSAESFAWCFQHFNIGKIIGEETGGYIVSFGDIINTKLPASKLQLYISHKEFYGYGATDKERHAVIPDYKVNADKALDFALSLIRK